MAKRFITQREINFIDSIDRELIQYVVGQEVKYYAILVPETHPHRLYNEAIKKTWAPPVRINARVKWDNPNTKSTQAGLDTNYAAEVYFHKKELTQRNVVPREGDYLEFGKVVFEITSVSEPDIIFGQVNQKTQVKCVCIPSREGQMYVSNLIGDDRDNTSNVETSDVDPSFSSLQTLDGPFGTTTKVIRESSGGNGNGYLAGAGLYISGSYMMVGAGSGLIATDDAVDVDLQENGGLDFFTAQLGVRLAASGNLAKGSDGLYVLSGTNALHGNLLGGSLHVTASYANAGFTPGTSGVQFSALLEVNAGTPSWSRITQDMILDAWSATLAGAQTLEVSQSVVAPSFTAAYTANRLATAAVLSDTEGHSTNVLTPNSSSFSSSYTFQKIAYGGSVTFTLTANELNGPSKTSSVTFNWLQKVYYGVAVPGTINEAFVEALPTSTLTSTKSRSFSVSAGATQKIYYAFRSAYGTPTFTVGGFSGGFTLAGTVSVTNAYGFTEDYDVWASDNIGLGSVTVVVT